MNTTYLLEVDNDSVIEKAATIRCGDQLRDVFIKILINPQLYNLVLWYIQERLQLDGLDLERYFNLPPLNQLQPGDVCRIIREEISYETDALLESIHGRIESL